MKCPHCGQAISNKEMAQFLGSLGGKRGGRARAAKETPEERSNRMRRVVQARWNKTRTVPENPA